jgi:hypothetical protein
LGGAMERAAKLHPDVALYKESGQRMYRHLMNNKDRQKILKKIDSECGINSMFM